MVFKPISWVAEGMYNQDTFNRNDEDVWVLGVNVRKKQEMNSECALAKRTRVQSKQVAKKTRQWLKLAPYGERTDEQKKNTNIFSYFI